jgi:hypothetical protein
MANMLGRVCHVAFVPAMSCLTGGLLAQEKPESDDVRRKAMESRRVQIDKEVGELRAKLEAEIKASPPLLMMCGNDVPRIQEWMEETTVRLKTLEGSEVHAAEAKRLKEELEKTKKAASAILAQAERREEAGQRVTVLKKQMTDLLVEQERLKLDLKSMWQ